MKMVHNDGLQVMATTISTPLSTDLIPFACDRDMTIHVAKKSETVTLYTEYRDRKE